jgi:hypothetical protein
MVLDGREQVRRSSVVQEKQALTNSPERRGPEFVGSSLALSDAIC